MYNPKHQRIGNPLKFYSTKSAEPIGERALSKLKVRGVAPLYAATKPKARSPMGFLLSGRNSAQESIGKDLIQAAGTEYL